MNAKRLISVSLVLIIALSANIVFAAGTYTRTTYDNGMNGKWAVPTMSSPINVVKIGTDKYAVIIDEKGPFTTLDAPSPGGSGHVSAGITGTVVGHVVYVVEGKLKDPMPTSANIDYRGDAHPNYVAWLFDSITGKPIVQDDWNWVYTAKVFENGKCVEKPWTDNAETEDIYGKVGPNEDMGDITGTTPCPDGPQPPKWFDPGDNRIDPRPGDRLAVYCNPADKPPAIVVYGIADNLPDYQKGFYLATFINADLLKAGQNGITFNLGAGKGSVSMMQDGNGHFYTAWNGGPYQATGQGIWSKSFSCSF